MGLLDVIWMEEVKIGIKWKITKRNTENLRNFFYCKVLDFLEAVGICAILHHLYLEEQQTAPTDPWAKWKLEPGTMERGCLSVSKHYLNLLLTSVSLFSSSNRSSNTSFPTVSTFEIGTFNAPTPANRNGGTEFNGGSNIFNTAANNSNLQGGGLGIRETGIIEKLLVKPLNSQRLKVELF